MLLLQTIDVSNNNLTGQPMSVLANVGLLERINLQNNRVGPASRRLTSGMHPSAIIVRLCVQFAGSIPNRMSSPHVEVGLPAARISTAALTHRSRAASVAIFCLLLGLMDELPLVRTLG